MAAAIVDTADLARGTLVVLEKLAGGNVERVGEHLGLLVLEQDADVVQRCRQREELAQRVPAQITFLDELLDMLGGGTASAGFEQTPAVHQWHDRKHLR